MPRQTSLETRARISAALKAFWAASAIDRRRQREARQRHERQERQRRKQERKAMEPERALERRIRRVKRRRAGKVTK